MENNLDVSTELKTSDILTYMQTIKINNISYASSLPSKTLLFRLVGVID